LDQHEVLVELLFRARAELRASRPSHSVLRAQVSRAAQKYLSVAQDATAAAHAELMAAQRQTDGARMAVLEQVLCAAVADSNISCTMRPLTSFGAFDPDWPRDAQAERLSIDEATSSAINIDEQARAYASNVHRDTCRPDVDSDLESAQRLASVPEPRVVAQTDRHGTTSAPTDEEVEAARHTASIEHERRWVSKADMDLLPQHTTLDPQQRVVPVMTARDVQVSPPTFTAKAARREPIAYPEELAEPPRQGRHTDRLASRRCQDECGDRESDDDGVGSVDNEADQLSYREEEHASWRAREGDRLTIPAWAIKATLLDC
jgi:hypothetical protein